MNLLSTLRQRPTEERSGGGITTTWAATPSNPISHEFVAYCQAAYKQNGIVFACILARALLFSQVKWRWRNLTDGDLFGDPSLRILERPWPGGNGREMLMRMEQDASLAGNAYIHRDGDRLRRLRPDWVDVIGDFATLEKKGFLYHHGGHNSGATPEPLTVKEVAHYAPIPDPEHPWRGMSWLSAAIRDIEGDQQMVDHKQKFFENAATPNLLVKVPGKIKDKEARDRFRDELDRRFAGVDNAYRTLILDEGADGEIIGRDFEQINFAVVQAAGENRITVAAGVPAIVIGAKEGLNSATYSNYAQAMRRFGDMTVDPLWGFAAADLEPLAGPPAGSELWYQTDHIKALREDAKDEAEVLLRKANAAAVLIRVGYVPDQVGPKLGLPEIDHTGSIPVTLYQDGKDPGTESPGDQGPEGI